jgi:hypothetical protein
MFSAFVDVFFVPVLEVDYGVVSDLSDEGVLVDGTNIGGKIFPTNGI